MNPEEKCCCGHKRKDHNKYVKEGRNVKGSRFVCTKDGCNEWNQCNLKEKGETMKNTFKAYIRFLERHPIVAGLLFGEAIVGIAATIIIWIAWLELR